MKKALILHYIIAILFIVLSLVHFLSLVMILRSWVWLRVFEVKPGTGVLVFVNLFFTLGFLLSGFFLLLKRTWAYGFGAILSTLAFAWFWISRTSLNQSPLPFSRQVVILVISVLFLLLFLLSLWLLSNERKQAASTLGRSGKIDDEQ